MNKSSDVSKLYFIVILFAVLVAGCGGNPPTATLVEDSTRVDSTATSMSKIDTSTKKFDTWRDTPNRGPASVEEDTEKSVKGYAVAYCPSRMIEDVPNILYAEISKDDLKVIQEAIKGKVKADNPDAQDEQIAKDTKGDSIILYDRMKVELNIDDDVFKKISSDESIKTFENQQSLEWSWTIKPKKITQKSIVSFKFFCVDTNGNDLNLILNKTINVAVKVDTRTLIDKWEDFLSNDPKTLLTVIIIPLITFISGLFLGKRKKS
ncbi:MAG: hypothetical protein WDM71_07940 [Ferruginibacter sp.]